jgi:hypothetical protein
MSEDTKSPIPIRYQQYGITVKLNPDKEDRLHQTFLSLPKTYPETGTGPGGLTCAKMDIPRDPVHDQS